MAIYTSNTAGDADKEIPRGLGRQLGLPISTATG
jgi:hypothetical protein